MWNEIDNDFINIPADTVENILEIICIAARTAAVTIGTFCEDGWFFTVMLNQESWEGKVSNRAKQSNPTVQW